MTMMKDLSGRDGGTVARASRGIGRAIAVALGRAGAAVAVNYFTAHDAAQEVVEAIRDSKRTALAVRGDVGVAADRRRLIEESAAG